MNRQQCARCPHRAYLHDDRDYRYHGGPVGRCLIEGCSCDWFVGEQGAQLALVVT